MTDPHDPIGELDLLAYADGRLDRRRRAEVEAYLAADPAAADRVRTFQEQSAAIQRLYDPVLDEPLPDRLRHALDGPRPAVTAAPARMAAAIALCVAAGFGGWWLRGDAAGPQPAIETFLEQMTIPAGAAALTPVAGRGSALEEASGENLLPVEAPDLSGHGYELVGRSLGGPDGTTLRLDYQGPAGPLSLFLGSLAPEQAEPARFTYRNRSGLYWTEGPYVYALTGADKELRDVAESIRRQITPPSGATLPYAAGAGPHDQAGLAMPGTARPPGAVKILPLTGPLERVGQL